MINIYGIMTSKHLSCVDGDKVRLEILPIIINAIRLMISLLGGMKDDNQQLIFGVMQRSSIYT